MTGVITTLFVLVCIDEANTPLLNNPRLSKFFSRIYVDSFEAVDRHEAFLTRENYKGTSKVILSGSCQLESLWCTENVLHPKCSIPHLLEKELEGSSKNKVKVFNVSLPKYNTGHNLNVFLKLLDDKDAKIFVWHNDLAGSMKLNSLWGYTKEELNTFLPFIFDKLTDLSKKYPGLKKTKQLLKMIEEQGFSRPKKPTFISSFLDNATFYIKMIFTGKFDKAFHRIRRNTAYLRTMKRRIELLLVETSQKHSNNEYIRELEKIPSTPYAEIQYKPIEAFSELTPTKVQYYNILTLQVIDELSEIYKKKAFVYIGAEPQCQQDEYYSKFYVKPLADAVASLKNISMLDISSSIEFTPKKDSFNCINLTLLGNKKVSKKMSEFLTPYLNESKL